MYDLSADDSLHFSSRQPHRIENVSGAPAEYISIGTYDLFGDAAASTASFLSAPSKTGRRDPR